LGINVEGHKEILGCYTNESEGANFWLGVLTDLQNRGVEDILIACIDNLKGFSEAITAIFPKTEVQSCIVHQIRNSLKYVASKDQKEFMNNLKPVYQAVSKDVAELELLKLAEKWEHKYPLVIDSWQRNWEKLSTYFKYHQAIRKLIYTTNTIEGYHRQIRKVTKTKGAFTSDMALLKLIFLASQNIEKKWTMPLNNWSLSISQLNIFFPDRSNLNF
jgi:transposase-like protein